VSPIEPFYDPQTLREVYPDDAAVDARIAELRTELADPPDEVAELMARGELVGLLRGADRLDEARDAASTALDRAREVGTPAQQHLAELGLAQVVQWQGDFGTSNVMFGHLLARATDYGAVVAAFTYEHAGKNFYDQGDYTRAEELFAQALAIREELELPEDQIESSRLALAAARARLGEHG
jgi:tetratricopeptide (TPR) repeat protein